MNRTPDYQPPDALELQALAAQDRMRLESALNATKNGRLAAAMIFALSAGAFFAGYGEVFGKLAAGPVIGIGAAFLSDMIKPPPLADAALIGVSILAPLITLIAFLSIL